MTDRYEDMFWRAEAILEGKGVGFGEPKLWYLAMRGYGPALLSLAARYTSKGKRAEMGRLSDRFSPLGMMLQAFHQGERFAGQHLAMTYFNIGDMARYRHWLSRAAKAGDTQAAREARMFELRKPNTLARRLRRLRPDREGF